MRARRGKRRRLGVVPDLDGGLQQKQDEVDKCSHMLKDMSEELEHLLEENKRLDQLNSRFAPIDPTTKIRFG